MRGGGAVRSIKIGVVIVFICALGAYATYETRDILNGPEITVVSPQNGSTVSGELVSVEGTAKNISFLSFNGRQIYTDTAGKFSEELLVPEGYTILELKGADRFNREAVTHIKIIRKDDQAS